MRDMHKWKNKIEFSLDSRQIFFLFFGLSVVGCFLFALGVMTARRFQFEPSSATASGSDSLASFVSEDSLLPDEFVFKSGLRESSSDKLARTRDPSVPPRDAKTLKADKEAEEAKSKLKEAQDKIARAETKSSGTKLADAKATKAVMPSGAKVVVDSKSTAKAGTAGKAAKNAAGKAAKNAKVMANAKMRDTPTPAKKVKKFTLQMKAFSHKSEAEKFADKLRHNGHDARVEVHQSRGRTWHRVRLGHFNNWDAAKAAKYDFEASEHVIAYVVSE